MINEILHIWSNNPDHKFIVFAETKDCAELCDQLWIAINAKSYRGSVDIKSRDKHNIFLKKGFALFKSPNQSECGSRANTVIIVNNCVSLDFSSRVLATLLLPDGEIHEFCTL
jgi:hypothetical protein